MGSSLRDRVLTLLLFRVSGRLFSCSYRCEKCKHCIDCEVSCAHTPWSLICSITLCSPRISCRSNKMSTWALILGSIRFKARRPRRGDASGLALHRKDNNRGYRPHRFCFCPSHTLSTDILPTESAMTGHLAQRIIFTSNMSVKWLSGNKNDSLDYAVNLVQVYL